MMYLPEDKWSPRYDEQFYTIRMKKYITIKDPSELPNNSDPFPDDDGPCSSILSFCSPHKKYPATYYEIQVLRGTTSHTIYRRYSQFHQLCKQMDPSGTMKLKQSLPSKTGPFHNISEKYLEERRERLYIFMREVLIRQECVNNVLVGRFLMLNDIPWNKHKYHSMRQRENEAYQSHCFYSKKEEEVYSIN